MKEKKFVAGSTVILDEELLAFGRGILHGFDLKHMFGKIVYVPGQIYHVESVEIVHEKTIVPEEYVRRGVIPNQYKFHLKKVKGILTTNHDLMACDRFVVVQGRKLSAAWFRHATKAEIEQSARSRL
jgi:hypothetical protein